MALTAAIVQARFGSTRLPGKTLLDLAGQSVLSHVLNRCRAIKGIDEVCCAVPYSSENDPVANEARSCGASVFRGSETDVLDRYYGAAKQIGADIVLRVTSDCPLVDPKIADEVLRIRNSEGADYACNNMPPTWPHGLDCEVTTFAWLERAAHEATGKNEREHVTPYIRTHSDARKVNLRSPKMGLENHRWTLDTPKDLEFFQVLFDRLGNDVHQHGYNKPLQLVEGDVGLQQINSTMDRDGTNQIVPGVIQKISTNIEPR